MNRRLALVVVALTLAGCPQHGSSDGGDAGDAPSGRWQCPPEWVPAAAGGCGPAVLLCASDGGAQPGACNGLDLSQPRATGDPDAGGATMYLLPDGAIGGAWSASDSIALAPAPDFAPVAGIPTCATGWTRRTDGTCDPALATDCGANAESVPVGGCAPGRDAECGTAEWPDVSAESGTATVLRVRAGADDALADGTTAHPFGTLAAAIARGGDGAWILIGRGSFATNLVVSSTLHLVGVCASGVTLTASNSSAALIADGSNAVLDVRGSTVRPDGEGITVRGGAHATLQGVGVLRSTGPAVRCTDAGSTLDARRVRITGTLRPTGPAGSSILCTAGAQCTVSASVVSDSAINSVATLGAGTALTFVDGAIRGTHTAPTSVSSSGAYAGTGSSVTVERTVLEGNAQFAAIANDANSTLTLQDSVVRGTSAGVTGPWGAQAQLGGTLRIRRTLFEDLHFGGVFSAGAGALTTVAESVIRGVVPANNGPSAGGLATLGGRLELSAVVLDANTGYGLKIQLDGSSALVTDTVVRDTRARMDGLTGVGITTNDGANSTLSRVVVTGSVNSGVLVTGPGAVSNMTDLLVAHTTHGALVGSGQGLFAAAQAVATCRHCRFDDNESMGAIAVGGASLTLSDSSLERSAEYGIAAYLGGHVRAERVLVGGMGYAGVRGETADSTLVVTDSTIIGPYDPNVTRWGRGLEVDEGASVDATRVWIRDAAEFGVHAYADNSTIALHDVIVSSTRRSQRGFGLGVVVFGAAQITLERTAIDGASGAAIACIPVALTTGGEEAGTVGATDLFVRTTRSSTIAYSDTGLTTGPVGDAVAYGLHVGAQGSMDITRATVVGGGYGFFASNGALSVHTGFITQQTDSAGAFAGGSATLVDVLWRGNANDGVIANASLQVGSSLPPPTPVCPDTGCQ